MTRYYDDIKRGLIDITSNGTITRDIVATLKGDNMRNEILKINEEFYEQFKKLEQDPNSDVSGLITLSNAFLKMESLAKRLAK